MKGGEGVRFDVDGTRTHTYAFPHTHTHIMFGKKPGKKNTQKKFTSFFVFKENLLETT